MEPNKILSAKLIDLVFDDRNKEYGAYELRNTYSRRIKKSLLITFVISALAFGGAVLANSVKKVKSRYTVGPVVQLTEIKEKKPPEKLPEPEKKPEVEKVRTEKLTQLVIKPDDEVTDPPPSIDDLDSAQIDTKTRAGKPDIFIAEPPQLPGDANGIFEKPVTEDPGPFTSVEVDAKFIGNWKSFLERNLNAGVATDNNAPAGRYSVVVQFVVDVEGNVSDIKTLTTHGYGLEAEAVRALKKATKWEPAIQNGRKVKAYRKQVITFDVVDEG